MDKDRWTPRDMQSAGNNEEEAFELFADAQEEKNQNSQKMEEEIAVSTVNDENRVNADERIEDLFEKETEDIVDSEENARELQGWTQKDLTYMYRKENINLDETARVILPAAETPVPAQPQTAQIGPVVSEQAVSQEQTPLIEEESASEEEILDAEEKRVKKMVRILMAIGAGSLAVICIAVVGFYFALQSHQGSQNAQNNESSMEDIAYDGQELYGVIEEMDVQAGTATVYSAESGDTIAFNLKNAEKITDQYGTEITLANLHRGQLVNVQYNAANDNEVFLFRLTSKAAELKNVSGALIYEDMLMISGASYSIDENLICLYQGQDYDIAGLTMQQVFTAKILDGHVYTVYVAYATGQLELVDYTEYLGGQLNVTSAAGGAALSVEITENMEPVEVLEGLNTVTITMDSATVYSGKVFVVSGEVSQLKLPESSERIGKVTLVSETPGVSVMIDGINYAIGETIELTYGQHVLEAYADGYATYRKTITVGQPYQRLLIPMTNNVTLVSITSALNGSVVYIDGEYYGTAPVRVEMTPGTYYVTLVTEGYKDVTMMVTVTEGKLEQVLYFSEFVPEEPDEEPESSEPESSVPDSSEPENSVPENSVPESSVPESSRPESSVPESSVPESSVPESSVPESSVPESSVPESSVPESSEPESSEPESSEPESSVPESSVPSTEDTTVIG